MNIQEKLELINSFETAYEPIEELVSGLTTEALHFLPPLAEAWSINDHLVHIMDAEVAACFRIRASIAEPGLAVPVWEEEIWQERLPYRAQDGQACFQIVIGLRRVLGATLRALVEADWEELWILHPSRGRLTLAELLVIYRDHAAFHEAFIARNRKAYSMSQNS